MKEYLKSFNDAECRQVANAIGHEICPKDKRIFSAGNKADDFYVIVRGQVGILYPKAMVYEYQKNGQFDANVLGMRAKYVDDAI